MIHYTVWGLVLGFVTAYDLSCPDQSQRRFLQHNCTSSTPYYTCLFNVISQRHEALCSSRDYLARDGNRKIRMPGITDGNCTENRYQPITFNASQSSDCLYLKSGCEEEGQVVVSNGTGSQDRSCRCDYRAGYTYIIPPRNQCACVPSEEDCSCRKMYCNKNEALSTDYKCEITGGLFLTVCKSISTTTAPPGNVEIRNDQLDPISFSNTPSNISGNSASVVIILFLIVVIVVVMLLWLRVCPEIRSFYVNFDKTYHVIQRDDVSHKYTVINGGDIKLILIYKSLLPIRHIMVREVRSGRILGGKEVRDISSSEQMLEGEEVKGEPQGGYRLWKVQKISYHVCTLQSTNTGTYDIIIINMFRLPSSLMDWWNRCHARFVNCIYNRSDEKTNISTNKTELIIGSLPEVYTLKDAIRGEAVTLELKESEYCLVSWLRLDNNDQLSVVSNDSTQQKYTGGAISNPNLTINQTCMGDGGRYCCFVMATEEETTSYGWKLRVIPQEHGYKMIEGHRSDTDYVRISVVSKARDCLEKNGVVVIKGREGTGKTKLALDLASMWEEKEYLPVIVGQEDDIKEEYDESNILYIFDHGNNNKQYWIDKLKQCLNGKQSGLTCKTVFMMRNYEVLKELKIKEDFVVDLDNGLVEDDKLNILTLYMRKGIVDIASSKESDFNEKVIVEDSSLKVKLDHDSVRMIIRTEPVLGFPLMAKQFCASRSNLHLGEKYFKNPLKGIVKKITDSIKNAREESAAPHEAMKVVVLAYITRSGDQRLNINEIDFKIFSQIHCSLFKDKPRIANNLTSDIKEAIQKAADSLVGDYLTCSDGVYEFIHPYYAKAVVLSLPDFGPLIVHYNKLELVLEYVRGERGQKDDAVVTLAQVNYPDLCELLLNNFFQYSISLSDNKTTENIGRYIYDYWIKDQDVEFCSDLISLLEKQVFRERELADKVLPLHVFSLLRYMTHDWNDLWIYSLELIQDVIIIYGLLALYPVKTKKVVLSSDKKDTDTNVQLHTDAAQNTEIVDKMQSAVNILITKLEERLKWTKKSIEKDEFIRKLETPLDQHGNTFFHYLVLYEDEKLACNIFYTCSKYVKKEWTAENAKGNSPIDLAVAFGRPKICKAFIVAYKTYYLTKFVKEEWMKKKEKHLKTILNLVKSGNSKSSGKQVENDDMVINLNEIFHPDIVGLVPTGCGADYEALTDILYKL